MGHLTSPCPCPSPPLPSPLPCRPQGADACRSLSFPLFFLSSISLFHFSLLQGAEACLFSHLCVSLLLLSSASLAPLRVTCHFLSSVSLSLFCVASSLPYRFLSSPLFFLSSVSLSLFSSLLSLCCVSVSLLCLCLSIMSLSLFSVSLSLYYVAVSLLCLSFSLLCRCLSSLSLFLSALSLSPFCAGGDLQVQGTEISLTKDFPVDDRTVLSPPTPTRPPVI